MIVEGDYLYVLVGEILRVVSLQSPSGPVTVKEVSTGDIAEAMYIDASVLYVGSPTGVTLIDITDPANASVLSNVTHEWQCDPVVADNGIAYVTLGDRGGNCVGGLNQLDILDVSNLQAPSLLASYPMSNPHGLAIEGLTLYVADGYSGIKVLDVTDPLNVTTIDSLTGRSYQDVIVSNNILFAMGSSGIDLFDVSNTQQIQLKSSIE